MFEKIDRHWIADILSRFRWYRKAHRGYWEKLKLKRPSGKIYYQWICHTWKETNKEKLARVVATESYPWRWELK